MTLYPHELLGIAWLCLSLALGVFLGGALIARIEDCEPMPQMRVRTRARVVACVVNESGEEWLQGADEGVVRAVAKEIGA